METYGIDVAAFEDEKMQFAKVVKSSYVDLIGKFVLIKKQLENKISELQSVYDAVESFRSSARSMSKLLKVVNLTAEISFQDIGLDDNVQGLSELEFKQFKEVSERDTVELRSASEHLKAVAVGLKEYLSAVDRESKRFRAVVEFIDAYLITKTHLILFENADRKYLSKIVREGVKQARSTVDSGRILKRLMEECGNTIESEENAAFSDNLRTILAESESMAKIYDRLKSRGEKGGVPKIIDEYKIYQACKGKEVEK